MNTESDPFPAWFEALEKRHLANLTFSEVRRAVQALSSLYVERRDQLGRGSALDGAGKRAAFAYFYGSLHFLLTRLIVARLETAGARPSRILDLGCGTGVAGAAWALSMEPRPFVVGVERHSWAAQEARWNYQTLNLDGTVRVQDVGRVQIPPGAAIVAAFTINELNEEIRESMLSQFLKTADTGGPVLIIEPIARRLSNWWDGWAEKVKAAGGLENDWRFPVDLPERLALMDRAAGLNHRELTARSLWLPGAHARIAHHDHDVLSKVRPPE